MFTGEYYCKDDHDTVRPLLCQSFYFIVLGDVFIYRITDLHLLKYSHIFGNHLCSLSYQ